MMNQVASLSRAGLSGAARLPRPLGARLGPALLVAPLLVFLLIGYVLPILGVLWRSIENSEIPTELPRTVEVLASWDGRDLPPEAAFAALRQDFAQAQTARTIGIVARRLNLVTIGYRTLILSTAMKVQAMLPPYKEAFAAADHRWNEASIWIALKRLGRPVAPDFLLAAVVSRRARLAFGGSIPIAPFISTCFGAPWRSAFPSARSASCSACRSPS